MYASIDHHLIVIAPLKPSRTAASRSLSFPKAVGPHSAKCTKATVQWPWFFPQVGRSCRGENGGDWLIRPGTVDVV